jgi:hypothetical protein
MEFRYAEMAARPLDHRRVVSGTSSRTTISARHGDAWHSLRKLWRVTMGEKKEWQTPVITVYGDVQQLTLQVKLKQPGLGDDFRVPGISDA